MRAKLVICDCRQHGDIFANDGSSYSVKPYDVIEKLADLVSSRLVAHSDGGRLLVHAVKWMDDLSAEEWQFLLKDQKLRLITVMTQVISRTLTRAATLNERKLDIH